MTGICSSAALSGVASSHSNSNICQCAKAQSPTQPGLSGRIHFEVDHI